MDKTIILGAIITIKQNILCLKENVFIYVSLI